MSDAAVEDGPVYPFEPLQPGRLAEIAEGVLALPIPVPFPPGAVNATILEDGDGWTVVDTGLASEPTKDLWREVLDGALSRLPLKRVIATHHHPDHIGLAGWLQSERGVELWTTRTAWLFARMMQLDAFEQAPPEAEAFHRRAGYDEAMMARYRKRALRNFATTVAPMPLGFRRIAEGDSIRIGGRDWRVLIGHGHAPEHACLLSEADGLFIAGDQVLPRITPNIGVYATEPEADPLGDWMESCALLRERLDDDLLILPGQGAPFRGARTRLGWVLEKHAAALDRLEARLAEPRTVVACFPALYRRAIDAGLEGLATVETVAHLNRLVAAGRATRRLRPDGVHEWRARPRSGR